MRKYLMKLFLLCFPLVGASSSSPVVREINYNSSLPTSKHIIIDSRGGFIATAFIMASQAHTKTCIVRQAKSAAFQVLLPACAHRYYMDDAVLQFHSAGRAIDSQYFSAYAAQRLAIDLLASNQDMANWMIMSGFPRPVENILAGMRNETKIEGMRLKSLYPWIKPIHECKDCPPWTKMVKSAR